MTIVLSGKTALASLVLFLATIFSSQLAVAELPAPPPLLRTTGESFTIKNYSEKILLLNIWASWCGPCRVEMPDLDELQKHFTDEPFSVIGVAADEMKGVENYLKAVPVAYPNYVGDPDQVFGWSQKLGNYGLGVPFTALVDKTGTVRWTKMGGRITIDEVAPLITRLLEEPPIDENSNTEKPK